MTQDTAHGGARRGAGRKQQWYRLDDAARADLRALQTLLEGTPEAALAYALHVARAALASPVTPVAPDNPPMPDLPDCAPVAARAVPVTPEDGTYTIWARIGRKDVNFTVTGTSEQDARQQAMQHCTYLRERLPNVSPRARIRLDTIARQTGTDTLSR